MAAVNDVAKGLQILRSYVDSNDLNTVEGQHDKICVNFYGEVSREDEHELYRLKWVKDADGWIIYT